MIIAVDFDGTLCTHNYPSIGEPNLKLMDYLIEQQKKGAEIILWTCRIEPYLSKAVNFCSDYGLNFDYVNENSEYAKQMFGFDCRKIYADVYIDDRAIKVEMK